MNVTKYIEPARAVILVALCLVATALPVFAQTFTGRIEVTAVDGTGAVLPGVTVELTGTQEARAVTNERGEARFLNLAPGQYAVVAALTGSGDYRNPDVPVGAGSIVTLKATMAVGAVTPVMLRNRLFFWGAFGRTEPDMDMYAYGAASRQYAIASRDRATIENYSAKVTAQISEDTRANVTFFLGDKIKAGRSASSTRTEGTTWNQQGPTSLYKTEINRTMGNSLFLTARYAHVESDFSLEPVGGMTTAHYRDDARVHNGSYAWPTTG